MELAAEADGETAADDEETVGILILAKGNEQAPDISPSISEISLSDSCGTEMDSD